MRLSLEVSEKMRGKPRYQAFVLLLLAGMLGLSSCTSKPSAELYRIAPPVGEPNSAIVGPLVAVMDTRLPPYAESKQLIKSDEGRITSLASAAWSSDLGLQITEGLAQRLRLIGVNAWALPLPASTRREGTLQIVLDDLLWEPPRGIVMRGNIVFADNEQSARSEGFSIQEPMESNDAASYSRALGNGLTRLSESAAQLISQPAG